MASGTSDHLKLSDTAGPEASSRLPHVALDTESRRLKGLKIERLLALQGQTQPLRMLEVGTGSGGIANYFGTHPQLVCDVDAVDVCDNRVVKEGFRYQQVEDVKLPFASDSFDVVISNHVIEHVGNRQAQLDHLAELRRTLRPDGIGYLAVPNRWMLVEPHYKLAFLSWLPHAWRTRYLRLARRGERYDCEPLQTGQIEKLLQSAGLAYRNICVEALRATFEIERPYSAAARVLRHIPDGALLPLRRIIPTLIYSFRRETELNS